MRLTAYDQPKVLLIRKSFLPIANFSVLQTPPFLFHFISSSAICAYLVSKYAPDSCLLPKCIKQRAQVDKVLATITSTIQPHYFKFFVSVLGVPFQETCKTFPRSLRFICWERGRETNRNLRRTKYCRSINCYAFLFVLSNVNTLQVATSTGEGITMLSGRNYDIHGLVDMKRRVPQIRDLLRMAAFLDMLWCSRPQRSKQEVSSWSSAYVKLPCRFVEFGMWHDNSDMLSA